MATDSSPPYNTVILIGAAGSVLALVSLKLVLDSYYTVMTEEAAREKMAPTTEVAAFHAEEQRLLTTSPTPIRAAMADVGRSRNISPMIEPRPSDDIGALKGWSEIERVFDAPPAKAGAPVLPDAAPVPTTAALAPAPSQAPQAPVAPTHAPVAPTHAPLAPTHAPAPAPSHS